MTKSKLLQHGCKVPIDLKLADEYFLILQDAERMVPEESHLLYSRFRIAIDSVKASVFQAAGLKEICSKMLDQTFQTIDSLDYNSYDIAVVLALCVVAEMHFKQKNFDLLAKDLALFEKIGIYYPGALVMVQNFSSLVPNSNSQIMSNLSNTLTESEDFFLPNDLPLSNLIEWEDPDLLSM